MNFFERLWKTFCLFHIENTFGSNLVIVLIQNYIILSFFGYGWFGIITMLVMSFATLRLIRDLTSNTLRIMIAESFGVRPEDLGSFLQKKFDPQPEEKDDGSKSP